MSVELGLEGKRALVTGAAVGIGRGIARWLAAAGCDVVVADKDGATLAEAAAEVAGAGTRVVAATTDLRNPDAVRGRVARGTDAGRVRRPRRRRAARRGRAEPVRHDVVVSRGGEGDARGRHRGRD